MNADDIRKHRIPGNVPVEILETNMLVEIAAQLAELNAQLRVVISPKTGTLHVTSREAD